MGEFSEQFNSLSSQEKHDLFLEASFHYFVTKVPVIIDGKPFDLKRHAYQEQILKDLHPDQTYQKAAQMGASLIEIMECLWLARYKFPHGILYLIPTKTDVIDFSKKKFSKVVEENPCFQDWIRDTDTTGLKRVGKSFILFRGMKSAVGLKVQDVDMIVYDEIEEASQLAIDLAEKRTDHSNFKWRRRLSVPSDYDVGINSYFQNTDERHWMLKCKACNAWHCLEEEFPEFLHDLGGRVVRSCTKCGKELDPQIGEWVAKKPQITNMRGYQITQLWSDFVDPGVILHNYTTTKDMAGFYNNTLGIPYTDVSARVTIEQVLALCSQELMLEDDEGPCMMGVDPGKIHYLVIGKKLSETKIKVIRLGIVHDMENSFGEKVSGWDMIGRIVKKFNVSCCVIDGRPFIDDCRGLAEKFAGKIFLYFHSEGQKGISLWRDKDWTVNINACEAMDASHTFLRDGKVEMPRRSQLIETFAKHCHNVGRKLEEDEETGDRRYYWKKLGEDHFRRAFNLMVLASERTGIARKKKHKKNVFYQTGYNEQVCGYGG